MVSATGIGSGLDVNLIIGQLMQHESRPLYALQNQETLYQAQLSAYGKVKNAVAAFQEKIRDLNKLDVFAKHTAVSSDEASLTATTNERATHGVHTVFVAKLATPHRMVSGDVEDVNTPIAGATGDLQVSLGASAFIVDLSSTTMSLSEIKDAINNAEDNPGVLASIITVGGYAGGDSQSHLILTSGETGAANTITLTESGGNVAAKLGMVDEQIATDATFKVDGFSVNRASNEVNDVLEGITLHLKAENTSSTLIVERDVSSVKESVHAFVDAYNALIGTINKHHDNELTKDFTMNSMKFQLRSVLNSVVEDVGAYQLLSEIGVHSASTGVQASELLTVSDDELENALNNNFGSVAALFATDKAGVAQLLDDLTTDLLGTDGIVKIRQNGIDRRLKTIGTQIHRQETKLEQIEERYLRQFSALDSLLNQLQGTSVYLTQQMSQMQNMFNRR